MDIKYVTPFIVAFNNVSRNLGFQKVQKGALQNKKKTIIGEGVIIVVGVSGHLKGNVVYVIDDQGAKKIASVMMSGAAVEKLDKIAKSALVEMTNIVTSHAATAFAAMNVLIGLSSPACFEGNDVEITMSSDTVFCIQMLLDDIPIDVNISFED